MSRYIAFLRAINVGGHTVKMDALRELFEALDLRNVRTFIASGNVLFDSTARNTSTLEERIERHLFESLGYDVATFIRTPAEVEAVSLYKPAAAGLDGPTKSLYVGFLKSTPPRDGHAKLLDYQNTVDALDVNDREVYWSCTGSVTTSTFSSARLEKTLKMPATFRNITTVRRLAAQE